MMEAVIANLVDYPHFGPMLAQWHADEWQHLYAGPGSTWNQQLAEQEFASMQRDQIPLTLIALFPLTNELVGSVSLFADDELPGYEHLTPWLGSLYVAPNFRGNGLAGVLIDSAVEAVVRIGIDRLFLFTSGQETYYLERGWTTLEETTTNDHRVTVMTRLTAALSSS